MVSLWRSGSVDMSDAVKISLFPRKQFKDFMETTKRWCCLIVHRRGGKTYSSLQKLLKRAISHNSPGPPKRYAYIAPTQAQAKDIAWNYLKDFTANIPGVQTNESELKVTLPDKTTMRLYSGESYERMRGLYFDGIIIDEPEDIDPVAWREVIRPCLTDYKGWCIWIGTVKGKKGQWKRYSEGKQLDSWFTMNLKASESGILDDQELHEIRTDPMMTEEAYRQEYENDPTVGIVGAIYAKQVAEAEAAGRVMNFERDKGALVHTVWDLGSPWNTRVIYFQMVGPTIRIIDHDTGLDLETGDRVAHMLAKGYNYGTHCLPHDANQTRPGGMSFSQELYTAGLKNIAIIPRTDDVWRRINRMREMFANIYFNKDKTVDLRDSLESYQAKEEKESATITSRIVNNWACHDSDAFGYIAEAEWAGIIEPNLSHTYPSKKGKRKVRRTVTVADASEFEDYPASDKPIQISGSNVTSYGKSKIRVRR